jgi:hypothetical protein
VIPFPGAVIAIQTFGDFLGFNPHCHILVTDGCFYGDSDVPRRPTPGFEKTASNSLGQLIPFWHLSRRCHMDSNACHDLISSERIAQKMLVEKCLKKGHPFCPRCNCRRLGVILASGLASLRMAILSAFVRVERFL